MTVNPRTALVGEIDGAEVRFAITDVEELTITHFASLRCDMFPSLPVAIEAYMASIPYRPTMAGFAVAGPVTGTVVNLTNLAWSFTREELRAATGATHVHLVNDFEALALSLPYLVAHDLCRIGGEEPVVSATKVVLGPGAGLGVAALAPSPGGWVSLPGEGWHVSFAVQDAEEFLLVEGIRKGKGHLSAERLISGPGLAAIFRGLGEMRGVEARLSPSEIIERALGGEDRLAEEAVSYFVRWLGRFAGDMALVYGARGGVYLGGGMAPKIFGDDTGSTSRARTFHQAFQDKGRLASYLATIPIYVVRAIDAGLRGTAVALSMRVPATS